MVEQTNQKKASAPTGNLNPTSRSQALFSIRTLKKDYAVIPVVTNSFNQNFSGSK